MAGAAQRLLSHLKNHFTQTVFPKESAASVRLLAEDTVMKIDILSKSPAKRSLFFPVSLCWRLIDADLPSGTAGVFALVSCTVEFKIVIRNCISHSLLTFPLLLILVTIQSRSSISLTLHLAAASCHMDFFKYPHSCKHELPIWISYAHSYKCLFSLKLTIHWSAWLSTKCLVYCP